MEINVKTTDDFIIISPKGRLDSTTSSDFEKELSKYTNKLKFKVIVDCADLTYISSAGLRVLLAAQKQAIELVGNFTFINVTPQIMEIFNMTGFSDFLTIK